jgi:hypothetical protein
MEEYNNHYEKFILPNRRLKPERMFFLNNTKTLVESHDVVEDKLFVIYCDKSCILTVFWRLLNSPVRNEIKVKARKVDLRTLEIDRT